MGSAKQLNWIQALGFVDAQSTTKKLQNKVSKQPTNTLALSGNRQEQKTLVSNNCVLRKPLVECLFEVTCRTNGSPLHMYSL